MTMPLFRVEDWYTEAEGAGELNAGDQALAFVPMDGISCLKNLQNLSSLDLSRNSIKILPNDFAKPLRRLRFLDLSLNQIETLTQDFGTMSSLTYFFCFGNKIKRLPMSFGQLEKLYWLDLTDNPLVPVLKYVLSTEEDWSKDHCIQAAKNAVSLFRQVAQIKAMEDASGKLFGEELLELREGEPEAKTEAQVPTELEALFEAEYEAGFVMAEEEAEFVEAGVESEAEAEFVEAGVESEVEAKFVEADVESEDESDSIFQDCLVLTCSSD